MTNDNLTAVLYGIEDIRLVSQKKKTDAFGIIFFS